MSRRSAGIPPDQDRLNGFTFDRRGAICPDQVFQRPHGGVADFLLGLGNGGQLNLGQRGKGDVVKADQRNLPRDIHAGLHRRLHNTKGKVVTDAQDASGKGTFFLDAAGEIGQSGAVSVLDAAAGTAW